MTTTQNLTPAAKRDLIRLANGDNMRPRYGPLTQLIEAGYVTANLLGYDTPKVTEAGYQAARSL